jgi:hypothetical protein
MCHKWPMCQVYSYFHGFSSEIRCLKQLSIYVFLPHCAFQSDFLTEILYTRISENSPVCCILVPLSSVSTANEHGILDRKNLKRRFKIELFMGKYTSLDERVIMNARVTHKANPDTQLSCFRQMWIRNNTTNP